MLNGRPHHILGRSSPALSRRMTAGNRLPKPSSPRPLDRRQTGDVWPGDGEN